MRHFTWSPENEVFLAQVDAEHRDLFRIADELQQAVAGNVLPAVKQQMRRLVDHAEEHFSHEEWLMQSVKYSSYDWHKQQHDTARRRLKLFVPLIESGNVEAADVFFEFLEGWLQDHTSLTDRMMAAHVRNYERAHATNALERWGEPGPAGAARGRVTVDETGPFPRTVRFCKACEEETTQEIRSTGLVCLKCTERSVSADLDRD
jgi:hemerythrin